MPIVDEKELLEKAKKKKIADEAGVKEEFIGDVKVFIGAKGVKYSQRGEALDSLQNEKQQAEYKKLGLDENGRSPEQVALSNEKMRLIKEKEKLIEKARDYDVKIASLKLEDFKKKK